VVRSGLVVTAIRVAGWVGSATPGGGVVISRIGHWVVGGSVVVGGTSGCHAGDVRGV
jgi:hypothetical protein